MFLFLNYGDEVGVESGVKSAPRKYTVARKNPSNQSGTVEKQRKREIGRHPYLLRADYRPSPKRWV